jgi:hypothetical protein
MTKYGVDYYQVGVAVVFALIAAVSIMLAIGIAIRHKTLVIANISMGLGIFILLFILCSGVTVAIVSLLTHCLLFGVILSTPPNSSFIFFPDGCGRLLHEA